MQLPTYTSIWRTKRIFYKIEDVRLPVPVPADVLLLTAVCFAVWDGFWWAAIGVTPFKAVFGGGAWFAAAACWYILPPFFAARLISRPNREGKNIPQIIASRVRYLIRPKTLDGYVSRRHIRAWLRARDARTAIRQLRLRDLAAGCRHYAGGLAERGKRHTESRQRRARQARAVQPDSRVPVQHRAEPHPRAERQPSRILVRHAYRKGDE